MAGLLDIFIGSTQSRYAGMAILTSLGVVGLSILFGKEKVSFMRKLVVAGLLILLSLPAILVTLFQLTCMVTGTGAGGKKWWCGTYAWLVAGLVMVYSALLVIVTVLSLFNDKKVKEIDAFFSKREYFEDMADGIMNGEVVVENEEEVDGDEEDVEVSEDAEVVEDSEMFTPTMPVDVPAGEMPPMEPGVPMKNGKAVKNGKLNGDMPKAEVVVEEPKQDVVPNDINDAVVTNKVQASEPETFANNGAPIVDLNELVTLNLDVGKMVKKAKMNIA